MARYIPDFSDFVRSHARARPHRTAVVDGSHPHSWADLHVLVDLTTGGLRSAGIGKGDFVAIAGTSPIEFLASFAAVVSLGGVAVPLADSAGSEGPARVVAHCRAKLVIVGRDRIKVSSNDVGFDALAAGRTGARRADALPRTADQGKQPLDLLSVSYTSGTTRSPKGVARSREAQFNSLQVLAKHHRFSTETVYLVATAIYTPMTWGVVMAVLAAGGACVFPRVAEPSDFLKLSTMYQPTYTQLVPTNLAFLLASGVPAKQLFDSFRRVVVGGDRMDIDLKQRALALLGDRYSEIYGTSESGAISDFRGEFPAGKLASVGKPLEDVRIEILGGDDGSVSVSGATGEIAVHTSRLMTGYLHEMVDPRSIWWSKGRTRQSYIRTGDLGYLDGEGYLWIQDRKKDVIISGGFNLFPSDIEHVMRGHPAVIETAVVAGPHKILGEVPIAFVVLRADQATAPSELRAWANARLDSKRRIHAVEIVSEIPRGGSGKVAKRLLSPVGRAD